MGSLVTFYALATLIALCSVLVVSLRNPVKAAVALVVNLFLLAGLFAMQGAEFVAAIQVIVYAGAIVVLFMFVIMLLNLDDGELKTARLGALDYGVLLFTVVGFLILVGKFFYALGSTASEAQAPADNTYAVAMRLFTGALWPFELASLLILLAMLAAIVIVGKKLIDRST